MWWVVPSRQMSTQPRCLLAPCSGIRERTGRSKARGKKPNHKLVGQNKDSLISDGGKTRRKKKERRHAKAVTQTDAQSIPRQQLLWKNSHSFIAEHDAMAWPISLVSSGHSCVPSQPLTCSVVGQHEEALKLSKHCSATAKALVSYQHWFGHKSTTHTIWATMN